ncbi:uncharacterized protein LOC131241166 isoform X2 [Magnolia sinica]|uniref:uncharacterized protein LOC131241166 isoform X2 n=1 Tax=Magnolia sinica TaxID=86752 RepID=UPI002659A7BA|nr:uncharacterized protein LOC131241166 isoform X2 [Magnolia sinica]
MESALHFHSCPFYRKAQECLYLHPQHCRKVMVHFAALRKHQIKLYLVPLRIGHALQCFPSKGSLKMNRTCKEDHPSFGVLATNDFKRSKTLLDISSISKDDLNDFETQLQEFFNEVKSMLAMGNKDDAIDLLQANYLAVKEQIHAGYKGMDQAAILDLIALGYMGVGDFAFVEGLLEMLWEIVGSIENDEPLLDSVLMHMGSMYTTLGKFENAMLAYRRGFEILESLFARYENSMKKYISLLVGKHSPFLITPLMGMAKVFSFIGRATKAIEIYHRAVMILEMSRGAECEDLVIPLCGLGNLLIKEGKAADAEISFKRILSVYTKLYGANDGRVGMAMCSLAHAMCAKGNLNEAIGAYRKGLQVIKDSEYMALDDDVLEKMRIDLAELLHIAGREHEGRQLLEECLLISERYKGKEHPGSVTHLLNLASSYSRSKNFVEAERLLRTSLQIMSRTVGPDDQSITVPMLHLAVVLYHLRRDEEAEGLALEVVRIREKAFGKQSLPVGEALDCLVSIQARLGKDDGEVLALLKRLLSIQDKKLGHESEETMITLKKVVFYLDKMGRKHEKLPFQRRLLMLRGQYKQRVPS